MKQALFVMGVLLLIVFVAFEVAHTYLGLNVADQFKLLAGAVCVVAGLSAWGK